MKTGVETSLLLGERDPTFPISPVLRSVSGQAVTSAGVRRKPRTAWLQKSTNAHGAPLSAKSLTTEMHSQAPPAVHCAARSPARDAHLDSQAWFSMCQANSLSWVASEYFQLAVEVMQQKWPQRGHTFPSAWKKRTKHPYPVISPAILGLVSSLRVGRIPSALWVLITLVYTAFSLGSLGSLLGPLRSRPGAQI